jgi:hypothetical protein
MREKVKVTEAVLLRRVNHQLAGQGQQLPTTRGGRAEQELGHCYVIDTVDPEELGRRLECLRPWEEVTS